MSLILSGSDGLSDVDGSAATPAIRGTDSNTGMFFPAADTIAFATAGTEDLRIDSAGNVGVGVVPSAWDTTNSVKAIQTPAGAFWNYANNNVYLAEGYFFNGSNRIYSASSIGVAEYSMQNGTHIWASAASGTAGGTVSLTERARIASDGVVTFKGGSADLVLQTNSTSRYWNHNKATSDGAGFTYYVFQHGGSGVGSISYNGSGVSYNTTSDYRLKEDVQPMAGALAKIAALKPCTYKWKADGSDGQGFIAHELQAVMPDCVTGAKDAVDAEGNPVYQGIDTSFLVATLTAAIQEQQAIITSLTARIAALEGAAQ